MEKITRKKGERREEELGRGWLKGEEVEKRRLREEV